ncbi:MAG: ribonucleoside-diphosphate reductase, adenosylcobalamin-dependent, partial [Parcubacteria group bacterium]|nr:ribonucleoside-diphosphate reductase, adenosylcobalamin-dependent [Parcubacteria group bacterium]
EALALAEQVYRFIRDESYRASVEIAREKGSFPDFDKEKYLQGVYIQRLPEDIRAGIEQHGIRNGVLQTQAPTGTTSLLAGVSSGIEPVYDFSFKRKDRIGEHIVYHQMYQEYLEQHPGEPVPDYFVNAKQLTPLAHVKMQAIIQKYTDASISKTVNAPEDHTHEDVKELYMKAYELGCKGVTYFRENSRDVSVLESLDADKKKQEKAQAEAAKPRREPKARPEVVSGKTYKVKTAYGSLYVTVNEGEDGAPFEVFAAIGKAGGFFNAKSEAVCRLASLALRSGIAAEAVISQLKGIRGPMPSFGTNGDKILSLPDAIAKILERHIRGEQTQLALHHGAAAHDSQAVNASIADHGHAPECPQCGGVLEMGEGCQLCRSCGYSKC